MKSGVLVFAAGMGLALVGCGGKEPAPVGGKGGQGMAKIEVTSTAFEPGAPIPKRYSRYGADVTPPLAWSGVPEGTKEIVLICDDPDAPVGTWVHWVFYGMPPGCTGLGEGFPRDKVLEDGSMQGKNSWGEIGYGGPQPPSGTHRYFFRVYAADAPTGLKPGATKGEVLKALEGHVIGKGELMGTYAK